MKTRKPKDDFFRKSIQVYVIFARTYAKYGFLTMNRTVRKEEEEEKSVLSNS